MGSKRAACGRPLLWLAVLLFAVLVVGVAMAVNSIGSDQSSAAGTAGTAATSAGGPGLSAHVLDVANGRAAQAVPVTSFVWNGDTQNWVQLAKASTDATGRAASVLAGLALDRGLFKLRFDSGDYFRALNQSSFFPFAEVVFRVDDPAQHYHIPLVLSNFGYSTYKGQ